MRFVKSLALIVLAALTSAAALPGSRGRPHDLYSGAGQCLLRSDAETLTQAYVRMISGWNDADAVYLSDTGFQDMSDSINILAGVPLGTVIFPTKQAFIDHQHVAPDNLPIQAYIRAFSCEYITLIFNIVEYGKSPVRGITILGAVKNAGKWQIKSIDMEMNSMAFLTNIGGSYTLPSSA